jgi:hypothetical protein
LREGERASELEANPTVGRTYVHRKVIRWANDGKFVGGARD